MVNEEWKWSHVGELPNSGTGFAWWCVSEVANYNVWMRQRYSSTILWRVWHASYYRIHTYSETLRYVVHTAGASSAESTQLGGALIICTVGYVYLLLEVFSNQCIFKIFWLFLEVYGKRILSVPNYRWNDSYLYFMELI